MVLYSNTGTDYWSFCQEMGCDWEGLLQSVKGRMDAPAFISLPPGMAPKGRAEGAVGVEVPNDYAGEVPAGYALVGLPAGEMVYFKSQPFENEDDFARYITAVFNAYENYNPAAYGYAFAADTLPVFNFGAEGKTGARIAVPATKL